MSEILPNVNENEVERAGQGESPPIAEPETPAAVEGQQVLPDALPAEAETPLPAVEAELPASIVLAVPPAGEAPGGAAPPPAPPSVTGPALARKAQPALVTRAQAFWMMIGSSLLAFCLAVVFVLALLSALNGGLRYARPAQLYAAQSRLDGLSQQAESLQASLDEMGSRLDQLESLGSRVGAAESELERLQKDVADASARVSGFQGEIDSLSLQVDALLNRTGSFQKFLDGLGSLLKTLSEPEAP